MRITNEKQSYGRNCEALACSFYQKLGYKLLAQNLRLKLSECDLIFENAKGVLLVEVRGKKNPRLRPSCFLSSAKLKRLKLSATILSLKYKRSVQTELFEVLGEFPNIRMTRFPIYFN